MSALAHSETAAAADGQRQRLWTQFAESADGAVRHRLVDAYQKFVRMMAATLYAKRNDESVEFDDYLQYARLALLESIDRFEPQRGIKFETFAAPRISGAILDGIASATELHEQVAARRDLMRKRLATLNGSDGGAAPVDVFARLAELAIGMAVGFMLDGTGMHADGELESADPAYRSVELSQLRRQLKAAVLELTANQRRVVQLHYLQHQAFGEIAQEMCLSAGRISQLHRDALAKLKTVLTHRRHIDLAC